jgi:hypothetical protein
MIDFSGDHNDITEVRIAAYSVYSDHLRGAQHMFEFVLTSASGTNKAGSVSVHAARRLDRHCNLGAALSRMIHAIASTPVKELSTLVEMRFADSG